MKKCVDCSMNGTNNWGKAAFLTWRGGAISDFILCKSCFEKIHIGRGWTKKEWKIPVVIDTLKNPREAVMF